MSNVVSWLKGRLGNQMFCVVAAAKIARENNANFLGCFQAEKTFELMKYNTNDIYIINTVLRKVKFLDGRRFIRDGTYFVFPTVCNSCYGPNFIIPQNKNIILNDFFQDMKFVDKDIAYEYFGPYEPIINEIKNLYGDLSEYVCVNVRRGDYLTYQSMGLKILSVDYINKQLQDFFKDCEVMLVSDDIAWCRENFKGERFHFCDKPCANKVEMDLYIQTQCGKGNIISNSSFSWWGAYLNPNENKKVIVQLPWFNMADKRNGIVPDDWIKV